jgi:hypothetical protein
VSYDYGKSCQIVDPDKITLGWIPK